MTLNPATLVSKATSWLQIIKALPYDGGPSTAKWVYLRVAEAVTLCLFQLVVVTVVVYQRTGHLDPSMGVLILGIITALFGFAANTKNQQQSLAAQLQSGATPTVSSSTPISSESESKDAHA